MSNKENARAVLQAGAARVSKKFSRKKSSRYAARVTLKWKTQDGKWVKKSLVAVSDSLDNAINLLLQDGDFDSLTSGDADKDTERAIASKTKRIVNASFDKYVERKHKKGWKQKTRGKIPKAARSKPKKKKSRDV